jgi:orotidine-5'-phosphate decarboxylase
MSSQFADRLIESCRRLNSPVCVGIDPMVEKFPPDVAPSDPSDAESCVDAIYEFVQGALEAVQNLAPVVKFQSAYFEQYRWEGVRAYFELIESARSMGFLVIGDVKRGDIGATSEAYARAHLADFSPEESEQFAAPDAITVNPFLGLDTLEPFVNHCRENDKGLFVLVRTSNPGSGDLQDAKLADGSTVSESLATRLNGLALESGMVGQSGWSALGAVVGATQTHTIESLRRRLPRSIFLLPGYGTQGATADMTRAAFVPGGVGAIVSASRSVLYPPDARGGDWKRAIRHAAEKMAQELRSVLG